MSEQKPITADELAELDTAFRYYSEDALLPRLVAAYRELVRRADAAIGAWLHEMPGELEAADNLQAWIAPAIEEQS